MRPQNDQILTKVRTSSHLLGCIQFMDLIFAKVLFVLVLFSPEWRPEVWKSQPKDIRQGQNQGPRYAKPGVNQGEQSQQSTGKVFLMTDNLNSSQNSGCTKFNFGIYGSSEADTKHVCWLLCGSGWPSCPERPALGGMSRLQSRTFWRDKHPESHRILLCYRAQRD